jgi:hypothetical protein
MSRIFQTTQLGWWKTAMVLCLSTLPAFAAPPTKSPEVVAREFFTYLQKNHIRTTGLDITSDDVAQERWLTRSLREALVSNLRYHRRHRPKSGSIPIQPPDNSDFLLAWDPPERFVVSHTSQTPYSAIVSGRCIWGPRQQYAGAIRPTFFILSFERGAWRVSDIQAAKAEFNSDMSLLSILTKHANGGKERE